MDGDDDTPQNPVVEVDDSTVGDFELDQLSAEDDEDEDAEEHLIEDDPNPVQTDEQDEAPFQGDDEDDETLEDPAPPAAADPAAIPGVRRSTRVRTPETQPYIPSMEGKRYEVAAAQTDECEPTLDELPVLHPDQHMMFHMIEETPDAVAAIMTQLSLKMGMKRWGNKARKAAHNEMKQLHLRDTFKPWHWKDMTEEQRKSILESHLFLKQKRNGDIKGRTVAGGNKQRDFISKEEVSSPTVATESVLLSCIIDAEEGRDVAVIDIPNAFIQTRIEDEKDMVFIRIRGILADMLVDIAPDVYKPYLTKDKKGNSVLIVQCQNAIYGTMIASLLYYRKFVKTLHRNSFELNPYDCCVANRMVNEKQQTLCFHVDDNKLSHVDPKVNDELIEELRLEYESIFEDGSGKMKVSRGKVHKYLGMTLDYTVPGQCKISMDDYIDEILGDFEKFAPKATGTKSSAAPADLFVEKEESEPLSMRRRSNSTGWWPKLCLLPSEQDLTRLRPFPT